MQLHPWNRGFEWRDRSGPFRRLPPAAIAAFDAKGYVVAPDLVAPDLVREATAEIDRIEAKVDSALQKMENGRMMIAETGAITFATHLVARSPVLAKLSRHPALVDLCADLIGPDVNLYWDQAVYKKPEKPRRFPWHQDNGYAFVEPQQYLTIWLALTDATRRERLPAGRARAPPERHAPPHVRRAARLRVLLRSAGRRARARARGRRRRLLVPHAAPHRTEHDGGGAQGVHPPVRAGRRGDPARRRRGGPAQQARRGRRARAPVPGPARRPRGLEEPARDQVLLARFALELLAEVGMRDPDQRLRALGDATCPSGSPSRTR